MKKKIEKIGEVSNYELLLKQRVLFNKPTQVVESRKVKRVKQKLAKEIAQEYLLETEKVRFLITTPVLLCIL